MSEQEIKSEKKGINFGKILENIVFCIVAIEGVAIGAHIFLRILI